MTRFDCEAVRAHWQALLDDEPALAARDDRAALDAHCAACADCAGWVAAAQRLREGLALRRPPVPPPGLADRLLAAARRDRRRRMLRRYVGFALAACLLIAAGTLLLSAVHQPRTLAVREGPVRRPASPPAESVADNLNKAGAALAALTRRTADEVQPTVALLPRPPAPSLAPPAAWPPDLDPAAKPLAEVRQGTAVGFEPVASTTRRALDLFRKQLPLDPDGS